MALVEQLQLLLAQIEFFENKIEQLLKQHMVSEFGDNRECYKRVSSVQAEAGTAPITESSGNWKFVHFRSAGRKSFRNTMHQFL